jgi:hypothetical protein
MKSFSHQSGISLVEVTVAMAASTLLALIVWQIFSFQFHLNRRANDETDVSNVRRKVMSGVACEQFVPACTAAMQNGQSFIPVLTSVGGVTQPMFPNGYDAGANLRVRVSCGAGFDSGAVVEYARVDNLGGFLRDQVTGALQDWKPLTSSRIPCLSDSALSNGCQEYSMHPTTYQPVSITGNICDWNKYRDACRCPDKSELIEIMLRDCGDSLSQRQICVCCPTGL